MADERPWSDHPRIAITGAPRTGKTTLALIFIDRPVVHSDDVEGPDWTTRARRLAEFVNAIEGPVIVEGVLVPSALNAGMKVDAVAMLYKAKDYQTDKQMSTGRGIETMLVAWLRHHPEVRCYYPDRVRRTYSDPGPR